MFIQAQTTVIRYIQKSVFDKIANNPNHFLHPRLVHFWKDGKDYYFISRELRDGQSQWTFDVLSLSPDLDNDLYERSSN